MKLSSLLSNGMVLQRNKKIKLWGESNANQEIRISFLDHIYNASSDQNGYWELFLNDLQAGGPYEMELYDGEVTVINDIYVGDVWVLGGQSNMQLPVMRTTDLFKEEIKQIHETQIRMFEVPQHYNFHSPEDHLTEGRWVTATQPEVMNFSAAGYFFAKELFESYKIPIGLIQTAIGGTPVEAWMSEPTLRKFEGYENTLLLCKDDSYIQEVQAFESKRENDWNQELREKDSGFSANAWFQDNFDASTWPEMAVPNRWEGTELENLRGSVWFRKEFDLPEEFLCSDALLVLGTIVDADDTYVNGVLVGTTGYMYPPRRYEIPAGVLRPGRNSIAVRIISTQNVGGFITDKPYKLVLGSHSIELSGAWKYQTGAETETLPPTTFFQYKPCGLYNGMISPLKNLSITGAAWYQGESNTWDSSNYKNLFCAMVNDWRNLFKQGNFPFLFTQLTNFCDGKNSPSAVQWARLREQQRYSLEAENTAMAVTIDIGEYNDLHPQNKKDVGYRLSLCAKKLAYGEDLVYSGPLYEKMKHEDKKIRLYFKHIGGGLTAKGGNLTYFSICGKDGVFTDAKAVIDGDTILVSSEDVPEPVHVRYAWNDNPEGANLFNKDGLPASPFSTE